MNTQTCRRHDWELASVEAADSALVGHDVCTRCGEERSGPLERRRFAVRLLDKAKKLLARGKRGRQGRMFAQSIACASEACA